MRRYLPSYPSKFVIASSELTFSPTSLHIIPPSKQLHPPTRKQPHHPPQRPQQPARVAREPMHARPFDKPARNPDHTTTRPTACEVIFAALSSSNYSNTTTPLTACEAVRGASYKCDDRTRRLVVYRTEIFLAYRAERANPVGGNVLKGRAGGNTIVGISLCGVVNVAANVANILFHNGS